MRRKIDHAINTKTKVNFIHNSPRLLEDLLNTTTKDVRGRTQYQRVRFIVAQLFGVLARQGVAREVTRILAWKEYAYIQTQSDIYCYSKRRNK